MAQSEHPVPEEVHPRRDYTGIEMDLQNISILQKLSDSLDDITQDLYCMEYYNMLGQDEASIQSNDPKSVPKDSKQEMRRFLQDLYHSMLLGKK